MQGHPASGRLLVQLRINGRRLQRLAGLLCQTSTRPFPWPSAALAHGQLRQKVARPQLSGGDAYTQAPTLSCSEMRGKGVRKRVLEMTEPKRDLRHSVEHNAGDTGAAGTMH